METCINNELKGLFERLCQRVSDRVKQQKPIQDDMLLNFNKMVISLVEHNFSTTVAPLEELSYLIIEYMRYGLETDSNKQRIFSYIRLSQLVDTFKTFQQELNVKIKAHQEAVACPENREIVNELKCVKRIPCTIGGLKGKRLADLNQKGLVIEGGIKDSGYYMLSKTGDALFRILCGDDDYDWVDQWSTKRIAVFSYYLYLLSKTKPNVMVEDIAMQVSKLGEKSINILYNRMRQNLITRNALLSTSEDLKLSLPSLCIPQDMLQKMYVY